MKRARPLRPSRRGLWLLAATVVVLIAGTALWRHATPAGARSKPAAAPVRTATVRAGTVERSLRVAGVTAAERFVVLLAPHLPGSRSQGGAGEFRLVLQKLVESGARVKKGEAVAEFDSQYMLNRLDDYRASLIQHEWNLEKLKAQLEVKRKAYEQRIRAAKGKMDKASLDLKTAPVRSAIQTERFRLSLEEERAQYRQLVKDFEYVEISEGSAIRRSELDLRVSQIETRRAEVNMERMTLRAPIDGLAVIQTVHRSGEPGQIQAGDQLQTGQPVMQIVDLGSMIVNAAANQVDSEELRLGARARVRFDAHPDLELPARVVSVGAIAAGSGPRGSYVKRIPVRLKLERMDARALPNISTSADLVLRSEKSAAVVPLEAVFSDPGTGRPIAFVQGPSGWEKRDLELGLASNVLVAVRSGLRAGEVVAAARPAE